MIAAVAAIAGVAFLLRDRAVGAASDKERRRWAALRGWQFTEDDQQIVQTWQGGALGYYGGESAKDVVAGSTFTADGRRPVYVYDLVNDGEVDAVITAVRCHRVTRSLVELWLPNVPFKREQMPELFGPVGHRYAFVSDMTSARLIITRDLVESVEEVGQDVTVLWLEQDWVLAAVAPGANPARLERLLRDIGEIADLVDPVDQQQQVQDTDFTDDYVPDDFGGQKQ